MTITRDEHALWDARAATTHAIPDTPETLSPEVWRRLALDSPQWFGSRVVSFITKYDKACDPATGGHLCWLFTEVLAEVFDERFAKRDDPAEVERLDAWLSVATAAVDAMQAALVPFHYLFLMTQSAIDDPTIAALVRAVLDLNDRTERVCR
jgi:hypothetical protein